MREKKGLQPGLFLPKQLQPVTWFVPASAQCTPPGHQRTWQQELCAGENLGAVAPGASRQREQPRCGTQACLTGQRLPGAEGGPAKALPRPCSAGSQGQSRLHRAGACPLADSAEHLLPPDGPETRAQGGQAHQSFCLLPPLSCHPRPHSFLPSSIPMGICGSQLEVNENDKNIIGDVSSMN